MSVCLIVDDSSTQRKIMCKIVEGCGYESSQAEDGLQALKICEESLPEIIILDLNMPNMSGTEFLKALREVPKDFSPYIIVCSANINTDTIVEAVKSGADQYHCKSSDVDHLRQKIEEANLIS